MFLLRGRLAYSFFSPVSSFFFSYSGLSELKPSLLFCLKVDSFTNVFLPVVRVMNFYPKCFGPKTPYYVTSVLLTLLIKKPVTVTQSLGILPLSNDIPHSIISNTSEAYATLMGQRKQAVNCRGHLNPNTC